MSPRRWLRATRPAAAVAGVALALVPAAPAAAHPNAVAPQPLVVGRPATVTVIVLPDEGPSTGVDVVVPPGFRLTGARGDTVLPTASTSGQVARFRGGRLDGADVAALTLTGVPERSGQLVLTVTSYLVASPPLTYPPVAVTRGAAARGGSGVAARVALTAGILALGAALYARRRQVTRA